MKQYKDMMKQMQKLQDEMVKAQEALGDERVEATAGGGAVRVAANGKQEILEIKVDPGAVNPEDVDVLEEMILVAVNDALRQAGELAQQRLGGLTGGMNIPGLPGM